MGDQGSYVVLLILYLPSVSLFDFPLPFSTLSFKSRVTISFCKKHRIHTAGVAAGSHFFLVIYPVESSV